MTKCGDRQEAAPSHRVAEGARDRLLFVTSPPPFPMPSQCPLGTVTGLITAGHSRGRSRTSLHSPHSALWIQVYSVAGSKSANEYSFFCNKKN